MTVQPRNREFKKPSPQRHVPNDSLETATVLVVEDDPILLGTLAYNLTRSGYRVLTAADGETGLAHVQREGDGIDLAILDIMLPGINGFQLLRCVRANWDLPVIMLSAKGEEQDRIDGLELGADDYVVKPFVLREFMARVRAATRRRAAPAARPPSTLQRGILVIELDRHRVLVRGTKLHLSPKEFGLLVTLAMEPGKVFGRQRLLDEVWGEEIIVDERTIDVHISWLRAKLQEAGLGKNTIQTVYGAGYRFELPSGPQVPGIGT